MCNAVEVPVNLTAILESYGIRKIERLLVGRFSVRLDDGRFGVGLTVGEALEAALAPDATNILKVAA